MIRKVLTFLLISVAITFGVAIVLILSQRPADLPPGEGLDFTQALAGGQATPQELASIQMRDGFAAQVRRYPSAAEDAPLLILVHGSGWHGLQFDGLARALSDQADVIVPDLRGHGPKPGRRGDIDYITQFEDDLADLIAATAKPGQKVVLGGHSSGGGLVVRFAGGAYGERLDAAVLMAPFLKYNAPTTRSNSGGWAHTLVRRIIGLSILNTFRITALNHLEIIQFRMPQAVLDGPLGDTATTAYSYRLNTGFAPRADYLKDVAALPPFTLIVGSADEAFVADQYQPTMSAVTDKGTYIIVDGVGHLAIVDATETEQAIRELLNGL
ncbi:Alpha/beta hydrolase [Sulfitobacter noctilucicola]|uniref:Pimeloyl-ACP methyl ester carboxylesterase n=1 Tax=Sulfitobacter noctilucicola TaxID=1342301 RepID=A0A7W6Q4D4_9RHOB|nr:alpha/beta fold hydrolase [Sulfitobacter noctilucicola]KIN64800.1 Alpha/beta hydrolase [Sulfitobacter noctilucicola]MBB4174054.1 pimeloyl-ACP methyl ester carboxylesterase [Sulfitobacter noctilucicola]